MASDTIETLYSSVNFAPAYFSTDYWGAAFPIPFGGDIDPTQFSVIEFGDDPPADFDADIDPTQFSVLQ